MIDHWYFQNIFFNPLLKDNFCITNVKCRALRKKYLFVDFMLCIDYKLTLKQLQILFIDLRTMGDRLKNRYYVHKKLFMADMMRIFTNCRSYNKPDTEYYKCANTMKRFFNNKLKEFSLIDRWWIIIFSLDICREALGVQVVSKVVKFVIRLDLKSVNLKTIKC
jgi:hypothetical protein